MKTERKLLFLMHVAYFMMSFRAPMCINTPFLSGKFIQEPNTPFTHSLSLSLKNVWIVS